MFVLVEPVIDLREDIRVGGYRRTGVRPLGAGTNWETERVRRRRRDGTFRDEELLFQTVTGVQITIMHYTSAEGVSIKIEDVRPEDAPLIDHSLNLVPTSHLELFNQRKPQGILIHSTAGRGSSLSYTGGLNPTVDDASTLFFREHQGIVITYGALWHGREDLGLDICPTILHEIGHVMTHDGSLTDRYMEERLRASMRSEVASRNAGAFEALCNAYMYMLCYGSDNFHIRNHGTGSTNENSAQVRTGLRQTRAFSSMLDDNWRPRFDER